MTGGIYLIQNDGQLVEMREAKYASEDLLQKLLADYTNLLAGDQIDSETPRRWILIRGEVTIPSGEDNKSLMSLDHLFLDQDSIPTLVEVKRSDDLLIRREVVGQMLDYASNAVVNWRMEEIRGRFDAYCEQKGIDPDDQIETFLENEIGAEEFWEKANDNLVIGANK
jgi:hypothetical protein